MQWSFQKQTAHNSRCWILRCFCKAVHSFLFKLQYPIQASFQLLNPSINACHIWNTFIIIFFEVWSYRCRPYSTSLVIEAPWGCAWAAHNLQMHSGFVLTGSQCDRLQICMIQSKLPVTKSRRCKRPSWNESFPKVPKVVWISIFHTFPLHTLKCSWWPKTYDMHCWWRTRHSDNSHNTNEVPQGECFSRHQTSIINRYQLCHLHI